MYNSERVLHQAVSVSWACYSGTGRRCRKRTGFMLKDLRRLNGISRNCCLDFVLAFTLKL